MPNATHITECKAAIIDFKKRTNSCENAKGGEACSCWEHLAGIVDKSMDIIKYCDISENSTAMETALKNCKAAFGKCRKYEDNVADIVYVCGKTMTTTGPTTTQSLASLSEALNKAKADKESALKEIAAANLAIEAASEASKKLDTLDLQKFKQTF